MLVELALDLVGILARAGLAECIERLEDQASQIPDLLGEASVRTGPCDY